MLNHRKIKRIPENTYFCFIDYAKASDYVDQNKLWKILQEMGIPDHLTCLLRNLYAGQEATVRMGYETMETVTGLLLGRKVMTNLDSILKSRDITNKGPSSQGYIFFTLFI